FTPAHCNALYSSITTSCSISATSLCWHTSLNRYFRLRALLCGCRADSSIELTSYKDTETAVSISLYLCRGGLGVDDGWGRLRRPWNASKDDGGRLRRPWNWPAK